MVGAKGFVLVSVLWVALLVGIIFTQVWQQALQLMHYWHHQDEIHEVNVLAQSMLNRATIPDKPPVQCEGWQQPLREDTISNFIWLPHTVPQGFAANWHITTFIDCYRHIRGQYWWRKAVRITLPHWQVLYSNVVPAP